ncbi:MAG: type I DNA topoisomerase [Clostridia bacterium]|nr:type I DNA topoisomerase [Clostridia bacterium]
MAKNLVIVESPAKAKTIQKYLGKSYSVEASMGHIRDLPKSKMGIDIENDFTPQYMVIRGKGDLIKKIKKEVAASDKVILATDPDREGEAISWHLMEAFKIPEEKACRVVFNEITKDAVKTAIKNPRDINYNLVDAQQARRVLDRIVGYSISPLLWRKVKKGLSAGRVQSVALKIICDREEEIKAFIPEEYWDITAQLSHSSSRKAFKAKFYGTSKGKLELKNEEQTKAVLSELEAEQFAVKSIKSAKKKRMPASPFITSTMQQEAARKLGFTSSRTMMVAQQLYEGIDIKGSGSVGLITYMRTDSTRIAKEAQFAARDYIKSSWGDEYLPKYIPEYKNKKNAQDAHEAIRPSVISFSPDSIKASLTADQFKLYKLIWERFIASQMAPAEVENTTVDIKGGKYIFKAYGTTTLFAGFTALYLEGVDHKDEDDAEQALPKLSEGDALSVKSLAEKQNFTRPPARYTEATLIRTLEELGIGRPSTYAPTISNILQRKYIESTKKILSPTELGTIVSKLMAENFDKIVDVKFTADMEQFLDRVEEGNSDWVNVIREFYGDFSQTLKKAEKEMQYVKIAPEQTDVICEKCGRNMVIRESRFGKFLACPGYPQCKNTKSISVEIGVKCPKCGGEIIELKSQKGAKYFGCSNHPKCDFMSWDKPTEEKCPQCGKMLMLKSINRRITKIKVCSDANCSYNKKTKKETKKDEK